MVASVIAAAGLAAYLNSFSGPFVFDDVSISIANNPTIRHLLADLGRAEAPSPSWAVTGRPVLNLSYAINYAISGTNVWSYHALNLPIHLWRALTLFGVVRRTLMLIAKSERHPAALPGCPGRR